MQALREQSVMSMPIRAPLWITRSASGHHLLSEEIDQQQRRVAFGAVTTQADSTAKQAAIGAAALPDEPVAATGAFVHGVHQQRAATLEVLAELLQIGRAGSMPQAKGKLLMGAQAIACAA
jgi:hypothetical protein